MPIWREVDFATLDLELTNQHDSTRSGICEVGAVEISKGAVNHWRVLSQLINPQEGSTRHAGRVHKIPNHILRKQPTFDRFRGELRHFLDGNVVIAHQARAEVDHLRRARFELGPVLDTALLAKFFRESETGNGLDKLIKELELRPLIDATFNSTVGRGKVRHTAYFDALTTAHLFVTLLEKFKPEATLEELTQICGYPIEMAA